MASRASSDPSPAPRASSARGSSPAAIPLYGTSWYTRGAGYWLRRAWFAFVMLLLTAFAGFVVLELYRGFSEAVLTSPPVRTVVDALEVLACCAALVWGWQRQRRKYERIRQALERGDTEAAAPERARTGRAVPLALIGRVLIVVMAPLVLPMIAYFLGLVLAAICVREVPAETRARYALEGAAR